MSKIDGGATLWARQTIDSKIFFDKPHVWFKIWFYLVNKVNHKDNKQFARGSCFMKYEWIMQRTKAKKSELDHAIRWLKVSKMIATRKATRGFIVEVLNYNGYQSLENYKSDSKSDSKSETKAKQKRNESDTINKNDKNNKNLEKDIKETKPSLSINPTKETDPLEFSFTDKCWYNLDDWRIKMYQGKYPNLTINYLLQDVYKEKFLSDPLRYKKEIAIAGGVEKLVWMWLGQDEKFRKLKEGKFDIPIKAKGG